MTPAGWRTTGPDPLDVELAKVLFNRPRFDSRGHRARRDWDHVHEAVRDEYLADAREVIDQYQLDKRTQPCDTKGSEQQ